MCVFPNTWAALKQRGKAFRSNDKDIGHAAKRIYNSKSRLNTVNKIYEIKRTPATYMPNNSNFSSTVGALKLRTNSPYSVMSRFRRSPPLEKR